MRKWAGFPGWEAPRAGLPILVSRRNGIEAAALVAMLARAGTATGIKASVEYGGTATTHTLRLHGIGDRSSVVSDAGDLLQRSSPVRRGQGRADRGRPCRAGRGGGEEAAARAGSCAGNETFQFLRPSPQPASASEPPPSSPAPAAAAEPAAAAAGRRSRRKRSQPRRSPKPRLRCHRRLRLRHRLLRNRNCNYPQRRRRRHRPRRSSFRRSPIFPSNIR